MMRWAFEPGALEGALSWCRPKEVRLLCGDITRKITFFKPFKISALFSTRPKLSKFDQSSVVFLLNCFCYLKHWTFTLKSNYKTGSVLFIHSWYWIPSSKENGFFRKRKWLDHFGVRCFPIFNCCETVELYFNMTSMDDRQKNKSYATSVIENFWA